MPLVLDECFKTSVGLNRVCSLSTSMAVRCGALISKLPPAKIVLCSSSSIDSAARIGPIRSRGVECMDKLARM
jgi:hypothetical protein